MEALRNYIVVGRPQIVALLFLFLFAAQSLWLAKRTPFTTAEQDHIWSGRQQWAYAAMPRQFRHTPLVNLAAAAPMSLDARRPPREATPENVRYEVERLRLLLRAPFLLAGIFLGVSVWYVSRRLYGNPGGYIALALYSTSPAMVANAASIEEALPAAWGIFGIVFTAIAISHNLYAPWKKWRYRTLLLAVAMAIAVASHPAAMVMILPAFLFLLYLSPGRRLAGTGVMGIALALAFVMVLTAYQFAPRGMMNGIDLREWLRLRPFAASLSDFYSWKLMPSMLPVHFLFNGGVVVYLCWRRTQYFGNFAPFMGALLLAGLTWFTPLTLTAAIWVLPFLFVFIGGIWADLLETKFSRWALGLFLIVLAENIWFCWKTLSS